MPSETKKHLIGRNVLVTGGAGFIGSHFVEELISRDVEQVVVVDSFFLGATDNLEVIMAKNPGLHLYRIDASDFISMSEVVKKHKIETVFDFATIPLPTSLEFPNWTVNTNVQIAATTAELARLNLVEDIVHISSSEVFGTARYTPMDEEHPLIPLTPYAASKAAGDLINDSYQHTFGIDSLTIRPFNNFGPRQNWGAYAGIIPIVIRKIIEGASVQVYGDGEQTRDFVYVRDTAKYIADIYCANPKYRTINLATGVETSINDLIKLIAEILGLPVSVTHLPERPGDVRQHLASTGLLKQILGRTPDPLNFESLKETVDWHKGQIK